MTETALTNSLIFLAYSTGIVIILVSIFLIKLLVDLSRFTKNLDSTLDMIKSELEPTIQEIKASLKSINAFVKSADERVDSFKKAITDSFGMGVTAVSKLKNVSGSIISGAINGFTTVYKMFSK